MTDTEMAGLCASCRNARTVKTRTSTFWLCELSKTDPRFPKYPRLPVQTCSGYRSGERPDPPLPEHPGD